MMNGKRLFRVFLVFLCGCCVAGCRSTTLEQNENGVIGYREYELLVASEQVPGLVWSCGMNIRADVYTIRNGKKISKEKVSYPGYVLVEAAMVGEIPYVLRNTPNVLGFLGDSKEDSKRMIATPLRPQEVARILGRVDELSQGEEENEIPFFVGETVKVTDGPFSSFSGVIEAVDNDRKKLTVSVKIFGRKTPMELSFMQVEKE